MDKPQFDALFAENFVKVQRYVERRISDGPAAEDIATETFLLAWTRGATTEITLPWLYRTASLKIADHTKHLRRRRRAEETLHVLEGDALRPMSSLDRLVLRDALRQLGAREREVILLTYWEQLTAPEIGQVLGIREGSVWTALSRARVKLRGLLIADTTPTDGGDHVER